MWAPQTTVNKDGGRAAGSGRMKGGRFGFKSTNPENNLTDRIYGEGREGHKSDERQRFITKIVRKERQDKAACVCVFIHHTITSFLYLYLSSPIPALLHCISV